MGQLLLLLSGKCPLLIAGAQRQCLRQSTVCVESARHPNLVEDGGGGWRLRILGFLMAGAFFDYSNVVAVAKKSKKKKVIKKNSKGYKGNY